MIDSKVKELKHIQHKKGKDQNEFQAKVIIKTQISYMFILLNP